MHKSLILICLAAAFAMSAPARTLAPQEALQRACSSSTAKAPGKTLTPNAQLAYTAETDGAARLYVFNSSSDGFLVVSADEAAVPLLGYADHGTFDPANMPENMRWWLEEYAQTIAAASNQGITATAYAPARRASVAPLLTSKWNQGAPYNLQCPIINGSQAVTGCVATAMAQVMYYHKWPAQGSGVYNGTDFADYTFDWDAMTPTYNSESSTQSQNAVATLMRACGLSVDANYGVNATGAMSSNMERAFIENFGYDVGIKYLSREWYTAAEWEDLVYADLIQGLPVLYDGQSGSGGHQFVCDGYADGYFHINWGWGGMSDGYFILSALDPDSQGIGGSTSGYNTAQNIMTGVQKPKSGSEFTPIFYTTGTFQASNSSFSRNGYASFISLKGEATAYFFNATAFSLEIYYGAKFTNAAGTSYYAKTSTSRVMNAGYGTSAYSVLIADVPDGVYTVTPAVYYPTNDKWYDIEEDLFTKGVLRAELTASEANFSLASAGATVKVSDFALASPLYEGKYFKCTATVTADRDGLVSLRPCLFNLDATNPMIWGAAVTVSVKANVPQNVEIVSRLSQYYTLPTVGETYSLALVNDDLAPISQILTVEYAKAPTTALSFALESFTLDSTAADDLRMHGTVKCNSGYLDSGITVYLFPGNGGYSLTSFDSPALFLSEGQSCEFEIVGKYTEGTVGTRYQIIPVVNNNLDNAHRIFFNLGAPAEENHQDLINVLTYDFVNPFSSSTPTNTVALNSAGAWQANKIALVDGVQFNNPYDFKAAEVEYTRTFETLDWAALYLPMDLTSSQWSSYASRVIEYTGTTSVNGETLLIYSTIPAGTTLKANHPYIFKPTATGEVTLSLTNTKVYATPKEDNCVDPEGALYTLHGTYEVKDDMHTTEAYGLKDGNFYQAATNNVVLKAFRVYLLPKPTVNMAPAAIRILVDPTEGITSVENDSFAPGVIYDLSGRRVDNPSAGIYIFNGQKILIK